MRTLSNAAAQIVGVALLSIPSTRSFADSFDPFGSQSELAGRVVVAAGNISEFLARQISSDNPLGLQKPTVYQIGGFCFQFDDFIPGMLDAPTSDKGAGILLVDKVKSAFVAEFTSSLSQINVKVRRVTLFDCSAVLKKQGADFTHQLDLQIQQTKKVMDRLKQQQEQ